VGLRASAEIDINVRQVERACARVGIPGPRDTPDGFAAEAPVRLVRALVERARELTVAMARDHAMIGYDDYELLDTARVLGAHAEDYISAATRTADSLGLTGRDRRRFLQRASRRYRVYFC
jgi:hypothetical protein